MVEVIEVLLRNYDVLRLLACEPNILINIFKVFSIHLQNAEIIPKIRLRSPPFPSFSTCNLLMILFVIMVVVVTESVVSQHTMQLKDSITRLVDKSVTITFCGTGENRKHQE